MSNKTNILVILDDQHRHDFVGYAGAVYVDTPNIDALAKRGAVFTHCCTNAPICAPARISLATGLLPERTGALTNQSTLPITTPNHYRHFRDHGYRVELVGRHDLSKPGAPGSIYGNRPLNFSYGFTRALEVEGGMAAALKVNDHGATGPYSQYLQEQGLLQDYADDFAQRWEKGWVIGASHNSALPAEHHQDAFVGRAAVERIQNMEDDYPWYMFVSFQSPHDPFDPPAELGEKYAHAAVPSAITAQPQHKSQRTQQHMKHWSHGTEADVTIARRQYCAKIELIDQQIGLILSALEEQGLADNTIVVFSSDHGEQAGDHGLYQKHVAYESSLRVPLIVAGPGIKPGSSDALVELSDLNPTMVELAGLEPQAGLDAASFVPVLRGETDTHRTHCLTAEEGYWAMRTATHKYIEVADDLPELYDLSTDPDELHNIYEQHPELIQSFQSARKQRLESSSTS
jgi:choline-sulfatase